MKLIVDREIFEKFPGVRLGAVVALGVNNSKEKMFLELLRNQEEATRKKFENIEISNYSLIEPWREIYRKFGSKPSEYSSLVEALIKRVAKGKELSDINALVNLYNALSLKYVMPFGAEDLDKVKGDIRLAFAKGDEAGVYLGSDDVVACDKDEVAYLDDLGFVCRKWNWREGKRTMLTSETKNAVLVTEAVPNITDEDLHKATEELAMLIKENLGGEITVGYLDEAKSSMDVDFTTGKDLDKNEEKIELEKDKNEKVADKKLTNRTPKRIERRRLIGPAGEIGGAIERVVMHLLGPDEKMPSFVVEHPADESKGDWASNVALQQLRSFGGQAMFKNPRELAESIVEKLKKSEILGEVVDLTRIEVAGPGFINFWLREEWLLGELKEVVEKVDKYGENENLKGKKVMVEFTDPNPFKEFHIGHLMSNTVGESLTRLVVAQGAEVKRANYQGDVGLHVAKSVWGWQKMMADEKVEFEELEKRSLKERVNYLGKAYAFGATKYGEDGIAKEAINELNKVIYDQSDEKVNFLYEKGRSWSLDYFETIYARLGTRFDEYFFESEAGKVGLKVVEEGLVKEVFEESQGAVIFAGEKYGLHTRVFRNKLGLPTYEAKDLGLAKTKFSRWPFDLSIIVTANEIDEYFKVLLKAMSLLYPELAAKTRHISHGLMKLKSGKMSSRTGNIITGEGLLDELKEVVLTKIGDREVDDKEVVADKIAVASLKYTVLKQAVGGDIVYDPERMTSLEGDSGPYLQYVFARCSSVLKKANGGADPLTTVSLNEEERALIRWLYRYVEVVAVAGENFSPHLVATYLIELAQRFNVFYNKHQIVGSGSTTEAFRLGVTSAVRQVIKNGLSLLGIEVVEEM